MFVDILVTTYKRAEDLKVLMKNLENQTYPDFRLQIFDGTPDDTVKLAVDNYCTGERKVKYEIIYHFTGSGMTRQRNIAVDKTDGDISIYLDDDVELEPDYLSEVIRVFEADKEQKIAGLNGYDTKALGVLGLRQKIFRKIGLYPKIGAARYLPWGHGTSHCEGGEFSGVRDCDLLIGFNMAFRTKLLKQFRFAPFYDQYPTYVLYDDTDISLRMKKSGYRIVQHGDARLKHNVSPDGRPPGFHYGFQTTFNAYRNWKTHIQNPKLTYIIKFYLWEYLNMLFLFMSGFRKKGLWVQARGRWVGMVAALRGFEDYNSWEQKCRRLKKV